MYICTNNTINKMEEKIIGETIWIGEVRKLFLIDEKRLSTEKVVRCMFRDELKRRVSIFVEPESIIKY